MSLAPGSGMSVYPGFCLSTASGPDTSPSPRTDMSPAPGLYNDPLSPSLSPDPSPGWSLRSESRQFLRSLTVCCFLTRHVSDPKPGLSSALGPDLSPATRPGRSHAPGPDPSLASKPTRRGRGLLLLDCARLLLLNLSCFPLPEPACLPLLATA